YQRAAVFVLAFDMAAGIHDIREHHGRTAENVIFQFYSGVNGDVVLDLHSVADAHSRTDHDVLTQVAVLAQARAAHDVAEVPDFCARPDFAALIQHRSGVRKVLRLSYHHSDGLSARAQRALGSIQHFQDFDPALPVGPWLPARDHAIDEMLALGPQWL